MITCWKIDTSCFAKAKQPNILTIYRCHCRRHPQNRNIVGSNRTEGIEFYTLIIFCTWTGSRFSLISVHINCYISDCFEMDETLFFTFNPVLIVFSDTQCFWDLKLRLLYIGYPLVPPHIFHGKCFSLFVMGPARMGDQSCSAVFISKRSAVW